MTETEWPQTVWSTARQITSLNGWPDMTDDHLPPAAFFAALRGAGRRQEAALFLAQALPRYEAVAWAARVIAGFPELHTPAADAVERWLADPSEANRRAAGDGAGRVDPPDAATLCALAVFHAGGSVAPVALPPAPPPRGSTGRFAGAAVIVASSTAAHPPAQLDAALDAGEQVARMRLETGR